jgi:hypothetical protein
VHDIAYDSYLEIGCPAQVAADGIKVKKSLRWVSMPAIAGIDNTGIYLLYGEVRGTGL